MLDFDASKLLIIGVVALVVIGPKDLPRVLRQVGQMVTKLRRMAAEFQGQFMDAMKEADLQDLREEVSKLKDTATLDVNFDPVRDVRTEMGRALDAPAPVAVASQPQAHPALEDAHASESPKPEAAAEAGGLALEAPSLPASPTPPPVAPDPIPAAVGDAVPHEPPPRRRVVVAKRRSPGDRLGLPRGLAVTGRSRLILPPRRDPRL